MLVDHKVTLRDIRRAASVDALVLLATLVIAPIAITLFASEAQAKALAVTFLGLLIWALVSATDVAKAFLGGISFRAYVGLRRPFQIGDRVTLMGHSGKVDSMDAFFVRLVTPDDTLVSIPTAALWGAPITSFNAGDRASLVTMDFHLAPFVTGKQLQDAEDAIWGFVQQSVYWDFDKPMQIYVAQTKDDPKLNLVMEPNLVNPADRNSSLSFPPTGCKGEPQSKVISGGVTVHYMECCFAWIGEELQDQRYPFGREMTVYSRGRSIDCCLEENLDNPLCCKTTITSADARDQLKVGDHWSAVMQCPPSSSSAVKYILTGPIPHTSDGNSDK